MTLEAGHLSSSSRSDGHPILCPGTPICTAFPRSGICSPPASRATAQPGKVVGDLTALQVDRGRGANCGAGAVAATWAEKVMMAPAEAARAPDDGATYTTTGIRASGTPG